MDLQFLGAAREVGRSCFSLKVGELDLLLDAGTKIEERKTVFPAPVPGPADAVVVTHCHLDHTAYLPAYFSHNPKNSPFLCTPPTEPITQMLLEDSLRVYEHRNMRPYYTQKDLRNLSRHAHTMGYGRPFQFHDGTSVEFLDAGHVIGSAQALVTPPSSTGEKPLLYTGDMKLWPTRMHLGAQIPHEDIGTLVIESTYAIKDHPPREELEGQFALGLREAVEEGCSVLVPTFAVGRAQEVLMAIYENKVHAQIYIDGMAQAVTQLVLDYPSYVRDDRSLRNAVKSAHFVSGMKREKIGANGPAIIVATAGMLEGGPILGYIQRLSRSGKLKVFLTGYQVAGTNGRLLLDKGLIRMNGKMSKINAEVQFFDFSAHSGRKELFSYVEKVNPEKVYTVHGEAESCIGFAKELSEEGFDATSPEVGKSYPA